MTSPQGIAKLDRYGFGLVRDAVDSHVRITHGGGINGFITSNAYFPDDSLSITVLANAAPSDPDALLTNIARAVFGIPLVQQTRAEDSVPLPDSIRSAVPGTYALEMAGRALEMTVSTDSAGVIARAAGQPEVPLIYLGDDTFGTKYDPSIRIRFVLENGRATRMTLERGGASGSGARIR
jgi:D-alanyl-D-alanine carboxypeptidase